MLRGSRESFAGGLLSGPLTLYNGSETAGSFASVDAGKRNARRWARAGWEAFEIANVDTRALYVGCTRSN